jgi:hypothetical protein
VLEKATQFEFGGSAPRESDGEVIKHHLPQQGCSIFAATIPKPRHACRGNREKKRHFSQLRKTPEKASGFLCCTHVAAKSAT